MLEPRRTSALECTHRTRALLSAGECTEGVHCSAQLSALAHTHACWHTLFSLEPHRTDRKDLYTPCFLCKEQSSKAQFFQVSLEGF